MESSYIDVEDNYVDISDIERHIGKKQIKAIIVLYEEE